MTYEEFQAGLTETPDLIKEIYEKHEGDFTKHLTDGKQMIVTTKDAYAKDREAAIGQGTKTAHTQWEEKFEKITGQKKPEGKKGLEWADELSARIKFLEEGGADPNSALIKGLQKELSELRTERDNEKQAGKKAKIEGEVKSAVAGLKFAVPSHFKKDDEKSTFTKQKAADAEDIFNARYTADLDANGKIVYTNKKGEAQTINGEPMTAEAIAARDFANDLIPTGHKGAGSGSGNDDTPAPDGNPDYLGKTTDEIRQKIAEMGVGVGTSKWADLYTKAHLAAGYVKENDQFVLKK